MAVSGEYPNNFIQLGSTLFVNMIVNGDIEACSLGVTGATNCKSVAVLTNTTGFSRYGSSVELVLLRNLDSVR